MSDRTSAYLFSLMFIHLADDPTPKNLAFAKVLMEQSRDYDFSLYQMEIDEVLVKLGLCKWKQDEENDPVLVRI